MTPKRCDTCVYWHPMLVPTGMAAILPDAILEPHGACRIGPPERGDDRRGRWPLTLADEYCHAHFPKEAAP